MTINEWGAACFGFVVGFITYRTLRRSQTTGLSDIATVIGAIGGAAITALFPSTGRPFGAYGVGLLVGFVLYLVISVIVAGKTTAGVSSVNEWLGSDPSPTNRGRDSGATGAREEIPEFRR